MPSLFLGVYTAQYDFTPSSEGELELAEGDVLYLLEQSDVDDWWTVKKQSVDGPDGDEPTGLVPQSYISPAEPESQSRALYDYTRQTEEEVSFTEGAILDVYHSTDPDWILVGGDGEYGFAPANYLEPLESFSELPAPSPSPPAPAPIQAPSKPPRVTFASPEMEEEEEEFAELPPQEEEETDSFYNEDNSPTLPARPQAAVPTPLATTRASRSESFENNAYAHPSYSSSGPPQRAPSPDRATSIPPSFRSFAVQEVDNKRNKQKATFAIGSSSVILVIAGKRKERTEWSVEDILNHSTERKHVFLDVQNPYASLDLHAGSTDNAETIGNMLNGLVGSYQAKGLSEVLKAAEDGSKSGDRIGAVLYDFDAAGDDEVSVKVGERVVIVDDTKSDEWWMVRRKDGMEGVVPSSYVEFKRIVSKPIPPLPEQLSPVKTRSRDGSLNSATTGKGIEVMKPKPDPNKMRMWTDRTGSFRVEASFVGCKDGKIHLHKANGVKIAVPASKMSIEDINFVERTTGRPVDSTSQSELREKLADRKAPSPAVPTPPKESPVTATATMAPHLDLPSGAAKSGYDWFEFFLGCGVDVNNCQRYAINFQRDHMDESVLEDITPEVLRTLGLKEGDILRVTRSLDSKFNRRRSKAVTVDAEEQDGSGLIVGPEGSLKTNRRSRPSPGGRVSDVIDAKALERASSPRTKIDTVKEEGFGDDAWTNRPTKAKPADEPPKPQSQPQPQQPALTGSLKDLSAIQPLQPTSTGPAFRSQSVGAISPPALQPQYSRSQSLSQPQGPQQTNYTSSPGFPQAQINTQPTGTMLPPPPNQSLSMQSQPSYPPQMMQPQMSRPNFASSQAPTGQNMNEMSARTQQQSFQSSMSPPQGMNFMQQIPQQNYGMQSQSTGYAMPPQSTGFRPPFQMMQNGYSNASAQQRATSLGNLPPPLQPQQTAQQQQSVPMPLTAHHTGPAQYGGPSHTLQQMNLPPRLQPQATGPPPPVHFGAPAKRIESTPTGRRANLAAATPQNPFGF